MKILNVDLRHGRVRLKIENLDDLWYLSQVIRKDDVVKTKSYRRVKDKDDSLRSKGGERKPVTIAICVEKLDFSSRADTLRISGIIQEGSGDLVPLGSYHTFSVDTGTILSLNKEKFSNIDFERLKDAEKSTFRPKLLIVVIDEGEANIGLVRETKVQYYDMSKIIGGKYETKGRKERKIEFYHDAAKFIGQVIGKEEISKIVVAGAGFEKENFYKFCAEKYPEIAKASIIENIGSHGRNGINEVMSRPIAQKLAKEASSFRDIQLINELLEHIGKDTGLAIYGLNDIANAAEMRAIEKLMLTDTTFIKARDKLEKVMKITKSTKGIVHIVNSESEAGQQLDSLGGTAAILRFKVQ